MKYIDIIILTNHGHDGLKPDEIETMVDICNILSKSPIECLKIMWEDDLKTAKEDGEKIKLSYLDEKNKEAYIYFKDGSYYHYEVSFATLASDTLKYRYL